MGRSILRYRRTLPAATLAALLALAPAVVNAADGGSATPCPRFGSAIVVLSAARELWLCARDGAWARFAVALGRGGVGKRRIGDLRTPLGTYAMGEPRPSERYGTFIPIVYPTARQAALGFSGTEVGIHGPPRGMDASTHPTTQVNWTQGCIATGTDEEVEAIAAFVRERRPLLVIR